MLVLRRFETGATDPRASTRDRIEKALLDAGIELTEDDGIGVTAEEAAMTVAILFGIAWFVFRQRTRRPTRIEIHHYHHYDPPPRRSRRRSRNLRPTRSARFLDELDRIVREHRRTKV